MNDFSNINLSPAADKLLLTDLTTTPLFRFKMYKKTITTKTKNTYIISGQFYLDFH